MPAIPKVPLLTIFNQLKELPIFDENRRLKKETNAVWLEACKLLRDIKRHNLYIYVQQNRNNIKKDLMRYQFKNVESPKPVSINTLQKDGITICENYSDSVIEHARIDDYDTLHRMKFSAEFSGAIQKICPRRFHLMYWCPEQINLWKDLLNLDFPVSLIVMDQLVQNVTIKNYKSGNIFLFVLAVKVEETTITLAQAITEKMESEFTVRFCCEYLKNNIPPPSELTTAYDHTLLNGVSRAFNTCSLNEYNLQCYKFLTNHTPTLPPTRIHVDTVTLIKSISGLECFNEKQQSVKKFYLLSIIYLSTVDSLHAFEDAARSILILILSPFENGMTESKRLMLLSKVRLNDIQGKYQSYIEYATDINAEKVFSFSTINKFSSFDKTSEKLSDYIYQLELQARVTCKSFQSSQNSQKEANVYYCPDWFSNLKELLEEFPVWTSVIKQRNNFFNLATSSGIQHLTTIGEVKKPLNASEFLAYHIKKSKLLAQQGRAFIDDLNGKVPFQQKRMPKNNHACLNEQENWMGKNEWRTDNVIDDDESLGQEKNNSNVPTKPDIIPSYTDTVYTTVSLEKNGAGQLSCVSMDNVIIEHLTQQERDETHNEIISIDSDKSVSSGIVDNNAYSNLSEYFPEILFSKQEDNDIVQSIETNGSIEFNDNALAHSTPVQSKDCSRRDILVKNITLEHNYSLPETSFIEQADGKILLFQTNESMQLSNKLEEGGIVQQLTERTEIIKPNNTLADSTPMKTEECSEGNVLSQNMSIDHNHFIEQKINNDCNLDDKKSALEKRTLGNIGKKKYVTPFPAMKIYHEQAACKKRFKETLIRNGNCLAPRTIFKKKYVFNDTSIIDSLAELMAFAYKNIKDFQAFCDYEIRESESNSILRSVNFFKILIDYCKTGNLASLYRSRALLLFEYGHRKGDTIFSQDKVGPFFSKIMRDFYSFREKIYCSYCDTEYNRYETRIERLVVSLGMIKNLQKELQNYFLEKEHNCHKCKNTVAASYDFGSYLTIDLENANFSEFLNMIPEYIDLQHNRYILIGIIGFDPNDAQHYIAYCRSIRSSWSKRDNIEKKIKHLRKLQRITIALIMYVRINSTS